MRSATRKRKHPGLKALRKRLGRLVSGKIARPDNGKSQGTMFHLDDQADAKKFAGKKVMVSGSVDTTNNMIHGAKIRPTS